MSLINKMLQDLDARGSAPGAGADPLLVRPVARPASKLVPRVALATGLVAVLAVGGWFSWREMARLRAVKPPVVVAPGPMPLAPVPPGMVRITPPQPVAEPAPEPVAPAPVTVDAPVEVAPRAVPVHRAMRVPPTIVAPRETASPDVIAVTRGVPATQSGSEANYRRALADLQEGRIHDAVAALERALQNDPRHDAARQTLVSLLVEAGRRDDTVRQLQLGLGLDPRQPAMAMLLARLQLEQGNAGAAAIDTLLRTLPYAQGNGDYQAFLAGVLQRQGRNREAAAQYQAALAATPGNAVWLMGLGIALQAEQRNADALAAFQQAAASGMLNPELQGFVERKVQQLRQ
jgi:MSHA biogenesis protein MshN